MPKSFNKNWEKIIKEMPLYNDLERLKNLKSTPKPKYEYAFVSTAVLAKRPLGYWFNIDDEKEFKQLMRMNLEEINEDEMDLCIHAAKILNGIFPINLFGFQLAARIVNENNPKYLDWKEIKNDFKFSEEEN